MADLNITATFAHHARALADKPAIVDGECELAMLERKRVLKQVKTTNAENGRMLIYENGARGDVFIVPDPQLRLTELENVQNEVAQLLKTAAHN